MERGWWQRGLEMERDGLEGGWREWGIEGWTVGWLGRVGDGGMLEKR